MKLNNQKGFTLIEIAIVLTIVGLIIGGIWVAASTVFNNNKAQTFNKDLIQIIQSTKTLFAAQGTAANTSGFNESSAIGAGVFPPDMLGASGTNVITPFAKSTTENDVDASVGTDTNSITYTFSNLPSSACAQGVITLGAGSNITNLKITGLTAGSTTVTVPTDGSSVPAGTALAGCATAGLNNSFSVTFDVN